MSKSVNLSVNGKTVDELSREFQKVFYRKAALIENKGRVFLQSYDTIVACIDKGKLFKLWDGYSATTARHICTFCYSFGVKPVSKKEWENMHKLVRLMYEKTSEKICTTARTIYFIMDGDLINRK